MRRLVVRPVYCPPSTLLAPSSPSPGTPSLAPPAPMAAAPTASSVMSGLCACAESGLDPSAFCAVVARETDDETAAVAVDGASLTMASCKREVTRRQSLSERARARSRARAGSRWTRRESASAQTHHVPLLAQRRVAVLGAQVGHVGLVDQVAVLALAVPLGPEPVPLDGHLEARLDARIARELAHVGRRELVDLGRDRVLLEERLLQAARGQKWATRPTTRRRGASAGAPW